MLAFFAAGITFVVFAFRTARGNHHLTGHGIWMVGVSATWAGLALTLGYLMLGATANATSVTGFVSLLFVGPMLWFGGRRLRQGRSFSEAFPWAGFMV